MAFVWETEARHLIASGAPVELVPIDAAVNQRGQYAISVVNQAPHGAAVESFLEYLTGWAGKALYRRHGFTVES